MIVLRQDCGEDANNLYKEVMEYRHRMDEDMRQFPRRMRSGRNSLKAAVILMSC